jgi:hypothetical protein
MKTFEKKLDRKYLLFLYKDKVNDIDKVFETFLVTAPEEITELTRSINQSCFSTALHSINRIIVALNAIGLPSLAVKLQIDFSKKCNALVFLKEFENELNQYMPVILNEYCRLKAYNNYIKIQPAKTLSI